MEASSPKRIFLSHKGADKQIVRDFKETLEVLGYEPWLDEDAMPAGTTLERGLLRGMQSSCAVVFFITPYFKDEGYLESEINYAIQEKREKQEQFAIIALQFADEDGVKAPIPELLKPYVWKTPKTPLEALREIVRALPLTAATIGRRDDIPVVTLEPTIPHRVMLSQEAKAILLEAVAGDGVVMYVRTMGGQFIEASHKSMIPDQDPRTVALWVGGLEDLQRLGYVKGLGFEGEAFEVTREGYQAASELSET